MNRILQVLLMLLVSAGAMAQGTGFALPAEPATTDSELASIVVLCATRYESDQLHVQWRSICGNIMAAIRISMRWSGKLRGRQPVTGKFV
ncbi:MAG: hypothetical protein O7F72_03045 [Proteobacteria bacterium]|nr:hypothetical protein [Pseudomonadota bacterium]